MNPNEASSDTRQDGQIVFRQTRRWAWAVSPFLFVATLVAGLLVYPFRDSVSADQFSLEITPAGAIEIVQLTMWETLSDHYDIEVRLLGAKKPSRFSFVSSFR
jgi:hypothetical protein